MLFVWVPCPLPSLGSHKLARCNSLPDGLAPAGVCLYIQVLTGGCGACSFCYVRCWECSLEGNRRPKNAYRPCCHTGSADKVAEGRWALEMDVRRQLLMLDFLQNQVLC